MIKVNRYNYFLQNITDGLVSNYFIVHRIHDVRKLYIFVKIIVDIHNLLKFFFLLLPSEKTNLSIGSLWFVHPAPQQCHTDPSVWSIHNVNHFVNNLQLLFGQCRLKIWRQILFSEKLVCCNNELISLSNKLFEVSFPHCKVQSKFCIFVFSLEYF